MMPAIHLAKRALRDQRGTAILEFALIAPVMLLLILGVFEFGYVASARSTLESATLRAARAASASECPAKRFAAMSAIITRQMAGISSGDGNPPVITVKDYGSEFGNVRPPEPYTDDKPKNSKWDVGENYTDLDGSNSYTPDLGTTGSLGDAGEVVTYVASYNVRSLVPFIAERFNGGSSSYPIRASTAVRNEPVFGNKCT